MLRKEQNDLLTQTGPGTPFGQMFRCYWVPALLAEELPENECPPVRVKLFSERLLAFRDTDGKYGLIDEFCAHRGVSLWFGRNEEHGLRCPYHGWKYDTTGQCIDVPSEPMEVRLLQEDQAQVLSAGEDRPGAVDLYGPAGQAAAAAGMGVLAGPREQVFISKRLQESNWLQAMEGGIDSSHVSFLHRGDLGSDPLFKGAKGNQYNLSDMRPHFEVVEQPGGLYIGARRNAENGNYYWRITPWVMPNFTMIPPRGDHPMHGHFWVPIDDHNCWAWTYDFHPTRALTKEERAAMEAGQGLHCKYVPGSYRPLANKDNDYLMDRAAQRAGKTYSGIEGFAIQDFVAAGKHGSGLRPHQGEPGLDRQRHHHGAPPHAARRQGVPGQGHAAARRRSRASQDPLGVDRAAAGPGVQGRRQGSADPPEGGHGADDGVTATTARCCQETNRC